MRLENSGREPSQKRRAIFLILCGALLLCLSQATAAQSGRRPPKKESPPPPAPAEPNDELEPNAPEEKPGPAAYLIVGGDRIGASMEILPGYVDEAVDSCIRRLRRSPSLDVKAGGSMTRKGAIDRAKKEKEAHVVWLEVKAEDYDSGRLSIGYTIFTPQTAKIKTSGVVFLGSARVGNGRVGVGLPPVGGRMPRDYQVREGGERVADRVMGNFDLPLPD